MEKTTNKCKVKKAEKSESVKKSRTPKHIGIVKNDAYLEPYENATPSATSFLSSKTLNNPKYLSMEACGYPSLASSSATPSTPILSILSSVMNTLS